MKASLLPYQEPHGAELSLCASLVPSIHLAHRRSSVSIRERTGDNYKSEDSYITSVYEFNIFEAWFFKKFLKNYMLLSGFKQITIMMKRVLLTQRTIFNIL